MIEVLSTNIVSPLGATTLANYEAVTSGQSAVARHDDPRLLPQSLCASLFSPASLRQYLHPGLTKFESLAYHSIAEALQRVHIPPGARTILILASTKGNVDHLATDAPRAGLAASAAALASALPVVTDYVVVCNACISGASAQLLALRLLETGCYDYAIACGADVTGPFVASGFSSLKALSPAPCRPFDMERNGLNLGEAAATIVYGRSGSRPQPSWHLLRAAVRNDAHHISNPPANAEGCYRAIRAVLPDHHQPACVSVHGTATLFNDQMESVALHRAALSATPVLALKGYYGHTLGATALLETILTMHCVDRHATAPAAGYSACGVSRPLNISASPTPIAGADFLKIASGFGGCNAALYFSKCSSQPAAPPPLPSLRTTHRVVMTPAAATLDGKPLATHGSGRALVAALYQKHLRDYPRFHKMDALSRVALVASELLVQAESPRAGDTDGRAVVLFNHSSSVVADRAYLATLAADSRYPSPSLFVYTLPNIAAGEIAIRHNYHGETTFYVLNEKSYRLMDAILSGTFTDQGTSSAICGWVDCDGEDRFDVELFIKERN